MRVTAGPEDAEQAERLRARVDGADTGRYYLTVEQGRVRLCKEGERGDAHVAPRDVTRRARGAKGALARACGVRPGLRVLDAMAGYGVDGLVLASLGCEVLLVERSPVVFTLLEDLTTHWLARNPTAAVAIECGDGTARFARAYDVIYLDPMFPPRSKSALPGKRLQFLHDLVGSSQVDVDAALLERARRGAAARVVLKRRRTDPVLAVPDWQIVAKSVRFDVYRRLES